MLGFVHFQQIPIDYLRFPRHPSLRIDNREFNVVKMKNNQGMSLKDSPSLYIHKSNPF